MALTGLIDWPNPGQFLIFAHDIYPQLFSIASEEKAVPWGRCGAEYVFDCTGNAKAHIEQHLAGGAKRVIVAGNDAAEYPQLVAKYNMAKYNKKMKVACLWRVVNCCV